MKVFILGGTGSIGAAVVQVLQERNHEVYALGRTPESCELLRQAGATPIAGDLRDSNQWIDICDKVDGVIHAAAVWGDEMGNIDHQVVETLLQRLKTYESPKAFIYTGGCWLYGATGDVVATEESAFAPLGSFDWSVPTIKQVLATDNVRGMVIHPAMVYERNGGVFEHIFEDAEKLGYVRVVGGENVRWPLIHRIDLAMVYTLMLEQGKQGFLYIFVLSGVIAAFYTLMLFLTH